MLRFGSFLERVAGALQAPVCWSCQRTPATPEALLCSTCASHLRLRQPAPLRLDGQAVHYAATVLTPALKRRLYGYKFYGRQDEASRLAGICIQYWHRVLNQAPEPLCSPEQVLVIPVPPHQPGDERFLRLARRFARHFAYDCHPHGLSWQREVQPQHTVPERVMRLANLVGALQANPSVYTGYRHLMVLDDLTTTGATLQEAVRAIRAVADMPPEHRPADPEVMRVTTLALTCLPLSPYSGGLRP